MLRTAIAFTIPGHPVGYTRTTQRAKYCPAYKRYQEYKAAVVAAFLDQVPGGWGHPKPLTSVRGIGTHLSIQIFFKNGHHADPDNVFKAIADSLFACDKYVSGDFRFSYDANNPRVEAQIQ